MASNSAGFMLLMVFALPLFCTLEVHSDKQISTPEGLQVSVCHKACACFKVGNLLCNHCHPESVKIVVIRPFQDRKYGMKSCPCFV